MPNYSLNLLHWVNILDFFVVVLKLLLHKNKFYQKKKNGSFLRKVLYAKIIPLSGGHFSPEHRFESIMT